MAPKCAKTAAVEESLFEQLLGEWERVSPPTEVDTASTVEAWESSIKALSEEADAIRKSGGWKEKPESILSLIGRGRRETYHCRIIAWLLDPNKPHGLGTSFLRHFLSRCGLAVDSIEASALQGASIECEVTRGGSRADIVVSAGNETCIVEAKVDDHERPDQCKGLLTRFSHEGSRFVFLTPDGRCPSSVGEEDRVQYRNLSFETDIREMLASSVDDAPSEVHHSTRDYLATLEKEFCRMDTRINERLVFYLRNKATIDQWAKLKKDEQGAADAFFLSTWDRIKELAGELGAGHFESDTDHHIPTIHLYKENWTDGETAYFTVTLEYPKKEAAFDNAYTALWQCWKPDDAGERWSTDMRELRDILLERASSRGIKLTRGTWWAAKRPIVPPQAYWEDLEAFAQQIVEEVRTSWNMYSGLIDEVFDQWPGKKRAIGGNRGKKRR